jgi:hypothetical protein
MRVSPNWYGAILPSWNVAGSSPVTRSMDQMQYKLIAAVLQRGYDDPAFQNTKLFNSALKLSYAKESDYWDEVKRLGLTNEYTLCR